MFFAPRGQRLYYFQTANFPSQCVDFFATHSDAFQPFPRQPNASKTFEDVPTASQTSSACRDHGVRKLVWKFKRDKSVEKQKISCILKHIGFSIKMCCTVLFMGKKICVYITYVEVNILVEKLTIHFYRLKLAAEIYTIRL